jgi:uncharacterized iron-regulated membrane protein
LEADMSRAFWVTLHRYAGLYIGCYLGIIGLAGSLIAFTDELEQLLAPELHKVTTNGALLDPATLIARAEALHPNLRVTDAALQRPANRSIMLRVEPRLDSATGKPFVLDFTEIYLDPHTGDELGRRRYGDLTQGMKNLRPFIYRLHYSFWLGDFGVRLLGITAFVWTLDCFVGFYLTLPPARRQHSRDASKSWWTRWRPAWLIKFDGSAYRIHFDLHRAFGLWTWVMLFVLAWSSVMFNLPDEVYKPTTATLFGLTERRVGLAARAAPLDNPKLDWRAAHQRGRTLLADLAATNGFTIEREERLWFDRDHGAYHIYARSSLDSGKYPHTTVIFDADDGTLLDAKWQGSPGERMGDVISRWLAMLHKADVFGLPMQILVCAMGLVITTLSLTGVRIWWKKRSARDARQGRGRHAETRVLSR